jgi:hypothetical protein
MQTQSYVVKASIAQSMEPKIKGCQTLLMAMLFGITMVGCGRTECKSTRAITNSPPKNSAILSEKVATLQEILNLPTNTVGLPCTNLTLRFEDMAANELLKVNLHELITARRPDGIYHWSHCDDNFNHVVNALVIRQNSVTWYRAWSQLGEERGRLAEEVDRSELLEFGSPEHPSKFLRIHLSNGSTQDVHFCVSVGA